MNALDYHRLGASIQALRKARGLSQTELAKVIGLNSPRGISELENGKRELRGSEIRSLCDRLECTLAELFGLEPDPLQPTAGACLRGEDKKSDEIIALVHRAQRQTKLIGEIEEVLEYQQSNQLPSLDKRYPLDQTQERAREQAIGLAGWARNSLGIKEGPIENLEQKLEEFGAIWTTWSLPEGVSGLTLRCTGRPFIILSSSEHEQRQRFTLAHELAHVLVDAAEFAVLTRSYNGESGKRKRKVDYRELRANHFAGVFLMSEPSIRGFAEGRFELKEPISSEDILRLASHFHVSFQAAAKTLAHFNFITWDHYDVIKGEHVQMRDPQCVLGTPDEVMIHWASLMSSTPKMLRLIIEALEKDVITFSRACELAMSDRDTLDKFLFDYSRAEVGMTQRTG
jgi:Zn-dependent peptidase ImmA (M78 family)/DNA-binding Xre family transcriptional regulator